MPKKPIIDKEMFKRSVLYNVKTLYRKNIEEATDQQIFQAVSYAVKDMIVDNWITTQEAYDEKDPKIVYYMSMEFLMGRALGNNMINLMAYKEFSEALEELGIDVNVVEDQAALEDLQHVSWIHLRHLDTLHTAVVSVIATVCSSRKSETASKEKCPTTGSGTAIRLS